MNNQNEKKEKTSDNLLKELAEISKASGAPIGAMMMASRSKGGSKKFAYDEEVKPIVGNNFSSGWPINNSED